MGRSRSDASAASKEQKLSMDFVVDGNSSKWTSPSRKNASLTCSWNSSSLLRHAWDLCGNQT